jgi:hypothetical protein
MRRAYDEHEIALADAALHKFGQLIAGGKVPLIKERFDPVRTEALRQPSNPGFVVATVPRIRQKCAGNLWIHLHG